LTIGPAPVVQVPDGLERSNELDPEEEIVLTAKAGPPHRAGYSVRDDVLVAPGDLNETRLSGCDVMNSADQRTALAEVGDTPNDLNEPSASRMSHVDSK